jgi:hypothetical protein
MVAIFGVQSEIQVMAQGTPSHLNWEHSGQFFGYVNSCSFLEQRETLVAHTRALFECRDSSMFQSVIEQIGPPVMCAEFADDCIDGNVVLIAIGVILGSIVGLACYHKLLKKKPADNVR